jgi:hypothetical protein
MRALIEREKRGLLVKIGPETGVEQKGSLKFANLVTA